MSSLKTGDIRRERSQIGHGGNIAARKTEVNLWQGAGIPDGASWRCLWQCRKAREAAAQDGGINNEGAQVAASILATLCRLNQDSPMRQKSRHHVIPSQVSAPSIL